jgi:hypothetical protein
MSHIPKIEPIKVQEFEVKQSKYNMVGKLPTRAIVCAPSGGGKTVLLSNLILDVYRGCFSRIYIFSPSIDIDYTWAPVKKYIEHDMKAVETEDDKFYFSEYDPIALDNIIETQHKITNYMKKHKYKTLFQILIVIDDFADDPSFTRQSKLLHQLYVRGRHNSISTITSTQKYNVIAPIVRINATQLYVFRLRNYKDLEAIVEELSAVADKKTLLDIYHTATSEPFSFLFVDLVAHDRNKMFHIKFEKSISIVNDSS